MKKWSLLIPGVSLLVVSCITGAHATKYVEECLAAISGHSTPPELSHYNYAKQMTNAGIGSISIYVKSEDDPEKHFGGCVFHDEKLVGLGFVFDGKEEQLIFNAEKNEEIYNRLSNSSDGSEVIIFRKIDSAWHKL